MPKDYKVTTEQAVAEEVKALQHVFTLVRLLSADEVAARTKDCEKKRISGDCYEIWKRNRACSDCIGYLALSKKTQFSKVEKTDEGVFLVFADYREVDGKPCVLEAIKRLDEGILVDFGSEDKNAEPATEYFVKTYTDILTDTYNRRYYEEYLCEERFNGGIAMIDLDDFKIYNDLFGHDVGDEVLKEVAAVIKKCIRIRDRVVRYGGDEFLLFVDGIKKDAFERCLRDIKQCVRETVFKNRPSIKMSVSVGYVLCNDEVVKQAVSRADEWMYRAKRKKDYNANEVTEVGKIKPSDKKQTVLIVDDSALNREILCDILKNEYNIMEADGGKSAMRLAEHYGSDISAVLLDLIMPETSGFDVLDYMNERKMLADIPVIAITGDDSRESMQTAYEKGVSDYITRPFDAKIVYRRVSNTIKMYSRQKDLLLRIKGELKEKDKNRAMLVEILSQIVERPDGKPSGHAEHMMKFTRVLLESLLQKPNDYNLTDEDVTVISTAAALHDIGKAQVDRKIINKKGKLTAAEYQAMKLHTIYGEAMLKNMGEYGKEPLVKYAREICRCHHERYDGGGYPDGLVGDQIPVSAQVVSVCDVYDALISKRSYKEGYSHQKAMEMILSGKCGSFNPLILSCFVQCADRIKEIAKADGGSFDE